MSDEEIGADVVLQMEEINELWEDNIWKAVVDDCESDDVIVFVFNDKEFVSGVVDDECVFVEADATDVTVVVGAVVADDDEEEEKVGEKGVLNSCKLGTG